MVASLSQATRKRRPCYTTDDCAACRGVVYSRATSCGWPGVDGPTLLPFSLTNLSTTKLLLR